MPYSDSISGMATDPDGDSLTFSKAGGPVWLNVATNGALSGTPGFADHGINSWTVQVADGKGGLDEGYLTILVDPVP